MLLENDLKGGEGGNSEKGAMVVQAKEGSGLSQEVAGEMERKLKVKWMALRVD